MNDRKTRRAAQRGALAINDSRGIRFAQKRTGNAGPSFSDMAAVPRWLMLPPDQQERVAKTAGLIRYRSAIDRELSGSRLAMLAEAVGEDLLDAVCADDVAGDALDESPLPRPDHLITEGWRILHRGLPIVFAPRFAEAIGDAAARTASERAVDLVVAL